jgi:cell fate (sporulation/competence/biofilm development) regulator YlbF (YheA/YmcA/DUF963 family)
MATTQEILKAAKDLGTLVATHEAARKLEAAARKLEADVEAQRLLTDFNRLVSRLSEKEAAGRPIEVDDKRQLEKQQNLVIRNAILRDFQMAQMDYLDLMRKVDDAISGGPAAPGAGPAAPGPGTREQATPAGVPSSNAGARPPLGAGSPVITPGN